VASETPEIQAWAKLLRAHAALTRRFSADLQATHGLTLNAYEVLLHLAHAPEQRMRRVDLAGSVLRTASGITRMLDESCSATVSPATRWRRSSTGCRWTPRPTRSASPNDAQSTFRGTHGSPS
jgi:hypothetical protein